MLLTLHPDNPQPRNLKMITECLKDGGVIIYPTDTIYGLGCDIYNTKAIELICRIKNIDPRKAQFSFICRDLSDLSQYAKSIATPNFRLLKQYLPGPYTFILEASKMVPKMLKAKKDTVGIRIPDHKITMCITEALEHPLMSMSLPMDSEVEYYTDPELMYEQFKHDVDIVVDGGPGGIIPSTIIDLTSGEPEMIREGAGKWEEE